MEDQTELAFILYFGICFIALKAGIIIIAACRQVWLKSAGALMILAVIVAAVNFEDCLQWAFERGLFEYLP